MNISGIQASDIPAFGVAAKVAEDCEGSGK